MIVFQEKMQTPGRERERERASVSHLRSLCRWGRTRWEMGRKRDLKPNSNLTRAGAIRPRASTKLFSTKKGLRACAHEVSRHWHCTASMPNVSSSSTLWLSATPRSTRAQCASLPHEQKSARHTPERDEIKKPRADREGSRETVYTANKPPPILFFHILYRFIHVCLGMQATFSFPFSATSYKSGLCDGFFSVSLSPIFLIGPNFKQQKNEATEFSI